MEYSFKNKDCSEIHKDMIRFSEKYYTKKESNEFLRLCGNLQSIIDLDAISYHSLKRANLFLSKLKSLNHKVEKSEFINSVVSVCSYYLSDLQDSIINSDEIDKLHSLGIDVANFEKNKFLDFLPDFLFQFLNIDKEDTEWWLYDVSTHPERKHQQRYYYSVDGIKGNDVDVTQAKDFIEHYLSNNSD